MGSDSHNKSTHKFDINLMGDLSAKCTETLRQIRRNFEKCHQMLIRPVGPMIRSHSKFEISPIYDFLQIRESCDIYTPNLSSIWWAGCLKNV